MATHGPDSELDIPCHTRHGPAGSTTQIVKLSRLTFDKSPLWESRTVGSVGEVPGNWHLYPTKSTTMKEQRCARRSWRDPAGESPAQVRGSARLVTSVASGKVTTTAKRTQ